MAFHDAQTPEDLPREHGEVGDPEPPFQTWIVIAERTTEYRVQARSREDAIDAMVNGEGEEIDGETHSITAVLETD